MNWFSNASLKPYNTFGMDVKCNWLVEASTIEDLLELIKDDRWLNSDRLIVGGGSNILFTKDFDGVVLLNRLLGVDHVIVDDEKVMVTSASGENWHSFVLKCIDNNWCGIENLSLIPGCVGASPIQNIGAYGVEIKDVFHSLKALNVITGEIKTFNKQECNFGYRESVFKHQEKGNWIIVSVTFELSFNSNFKVGYGDIKKYLDEMGVSEVTIKDVSQAVCAIRSSKLPDPKVLGNAGSFFKNPVITSSHFDHLKSKFENIPSYPIDATSVKVPAGWLIEQCGWKGKRLGNCGVNEKQALVLVNYGSATGKEVFDLSACIIADVQSQFEITLEREVNIL